MKLFHCNPNVRVPRSGSDKVKESSLNSVQYETLLLGLLGSKQEIYVNRTYTSYLKRLHCYKILLNQNEPWFLDGI